MFELSTTFHFEAAHRLVLNYPDKCKNLHGHSFKVTCFVSGTTLNSFGMLSDFSEFKVVKNWCKENWDHSTLVCNEDKETIDFLQKTNQRYFIFNNNPTSEVIAKFLLDKSSELGFQLDAVSIDETCTHQCKVYRK